MLCGSTAGSPVDVMARELAKQMEKILRKPVVVQNNRVDPRRKNSPR